MVLRARILAAFALAGLATSPGAANTIDLRKQTSAEGISEVGFCSRPSPDAGGFPGHSFVTFSKPRPQGGRDFRAVGHTIAAGVSPVSAAFTYFGGASVAGKQMEERYTSIKQVCLVVQLDPADYARAVATAQPTLTAIGIPAAIAASAERYSLGNNDCVTLAYRVAATLAQAGLNVPARSPTDTPASWIAKLKQANAG